MLEFEPFIGPQYYYQRQEFYNLESTLSADDCKVIA